MQDQNNESIPELEFLSGQARLACAEGVWSGVDSGTRTLALGLMKQYGWTKYRALREAWGFSQVQMAQALNVWLPTYQALELTESEPCEWTSVYGLTGSISVDG